MFFYSEHLLPIIDAPLLYCNPLYQPRVPLTSISVPLHSLLFTSFLYFSSIYSFIKLLISSPPMYYLLFPSLSHSYSLLVVYIPLAKRVLQFSLPLNIFLSNTYITSLHFTISHLSSVLSYCCSPPTPF